MKYTGLQGNEPAAHGQVMRAGMLVCSFQLSDQAEFCAIPGSHKANYVAPEEIQLYERDREVVHNVPCRAVDCILFLEATVQ